MWPQKTLDYPPKTTCPGNHRPKSIDEHRPLYLRIKRGEERLKPWEKQAGPLEKTQRQVDQPKKPC